MKPESLTGLIMYSPNPARLASFYEEVAGIPFELAQHGPVRVHREALWRGVHFAIWEGAERRNVPTFRVADVASFAASLAARGVPPIGDIIDIGEGKRLASFRDPDGSEFRIIQVG
jgi:predicted enzyme related to lactoylglutathione lyase